jgi:hypothetical protein
MKRTHNSLLVGFPLLAFALTLTSVSAETAAVVAAKTQAAIARGNLPSWWTPTLPEKVQADVTGKATRLAAQLELSDEAQTQKVVALLSEHFGRVWAWHQQVDEQLKAAWQAWDAARDNSNGKQKDELKALTIMTEQIDPIYAEFAPPIQGLLRSLRQEVGEEQTIALLDRITRSPGAKRTFDAYVAMVPEMSEGENWPTATENNEEPADVPKSTFSDSAATWDSAARKATLKITRRLKLLRFIMNIQ